MSISVGTSTTLINLAFGSLLLVLSGCQAAQPRSVAEGPCADLESQIHFASGLETLQRVAKAFERKCFETVIGIGTPARVAYRDKTFSVIKEMASVVIPDGTLTDYVLESYERGYLSVLLAMSYIHLHRWEEAKIELRLLDHELFTPLYNYGEDPVNLLLSAVLWELVAEPQEARVDWLRLRDLAFPLGGMDDTFLDFAAQQVERIDRGHAMHSPWGIYGVGKFPRLNWELQFWGSQNGYFLVEADEAFPLSCVSDAGIQLSTSAWLAKIASRHASDYHPLLNLQSWVRLPFGLTYSLVPFTAGTTLLLGGCALDAMGRGDGTLCRLSVELGMDLIETTPKVLKGALQPDLRHWKEVPAAFIITTRDKLAQDQCFREAGHLAYPLA